MIVTCDIETVLMCIANVNVYATMLTIQLISKIIRALRESVCITEFKSRPRLEQVRVFTREYTILLIRAFCEISWTHIEWLNVSDTHTHTHRTTIGPLETERKKTYRKPVICIYKYNSESICDNNSHTIFFSFDRRFRSRWNWMSWETYRIEE